MTLIVRNRDYRRTRARITHRICGDDHNRIRSTVQVVVVSCCNQWYLEQVATSARTQSNAAARLELAVLIDYRIVAGGNAGRSRCNCSRYGYGNGLAVRRP